MTKEVVGGQQVKTVVQGREKNHAIELLRFFFALMIVGYHVGTIYASSLGLESTIWMAGAGEILFVFTLTAGYFLVSHFKRLQANPEYTARSASGRAWEYLWGRIKALLPVLALGILLGVVAMTTWNGYSFQTAFLSVVNGLWEFLGLYSAGFNAGLRQANGALWFISSLLIVSYFIYFVLCKNEDLFRGFIAPFLFVFFGGWWAYTGTRAAQGGWSTFGAQTGTGVTTGNGGKSQSIGFNNGLLFVLIGMCGGALIYYAVEKLKKLNWTKAARIVLTVVYAISLVVLLMYTLNPSWFAGDYIISGAAGVSVIPATKSFYRWTAHLLCILVVGITMLGEDYLTKLLNNKYTAKVFDFLGGSALYIYILHCPFIFFFPQWFGITAATVRTAEIPYTIAAVYFTVVAISIPLGVVVKYLMDRFVLKKYSKKVDAKGVAPAKTSSINSVVAAPAKVAPKAPAKKAPAKKAVAKKAEVKKVEAKKAPAKVAPKAPAKKAPAKVAPKAPAKKAPAKTVAKKTTKK